MREGGLLRTGQFGGDHCGLCLFLRVLVGHSGWRSQRGFWYVWGVGKGISWIRLRRWNPLVWNCRRGEGAGSLCEPENLSLECGLGRVVRGVWWWVCGRGMRDSFVRARRSDHMSWVC